MSRLGSAALTVVMLVVGALLFAGRLAPDSLAQTPPDRSEVVLVLDFSASILEDVANRNRFAAAVDRIADRIDATSSDLVAGDTTVTIVQFATSAADYADCVDLKLIESPQTVARFADCLRNVAKAYRKGLDPALTRKIGVDTNYVAAMERAARHLALDAVRPALILFTDGKHDVQGVPVSQVQPARDRLFGSRSPFALLPVGMGLSSTERDALESGLLELRIIREMPACVSGTKFDWPQVVFESADDAGNAVAVALQDVTCTFTVAPTPTPSPTATPVPTPTPGAVRSVRLTPGDGRIEVAWIAPATTPLPIVDYRIRCRSGEGEWIESEEGASLETSAVVEGLTNGAAYECAVAVVDARSEGSWTAAPTTATPVGRPAAPGKPALEARDRAVRIQVPAVDASLVSDYRYECSDDQGRTWPVGIDVASSGITTTEIGSLTNGVEYVCRAFAANAAGRSDPSEASNAVRPCGSLLECNPAIPPILGLVGFLLLGGLLATLVALYRDRTRGYVVAVVDVVHTANLGPGSRLGIGFVRARPGGPVTGIVADRTGNADVRIRHRGGDRFEVSDRVDQHVATSGQPVIMTDSLGVRHQVILRRFRTATASPVSSRR
ncbi:MAG: fibronectin type III domain-containing protein [Candidatus Limnocylindrales bacterium]|nr:fibronectin type III domain-containing protein [Candidatus Limnocylindrales bacterium]